MMALGFCKELGMDAGPHRRDKLPYVCETSRRNRPVGC
jgi:hypothetical protein